MQKLACLILKQLIMENMYAGIVHMTLLMHIIIVDGASTIIALCMGYYCSHYGECQIVLTTEAHLTTNFLLYF